MSLNHFIPQIWSARMLNALRSSLVYAQIGVINRDYQGEIANVGDTVRIHSLGDPTIFDYVKNVDMPGVETLTDSELTLLIDQAKGFNLQVDDVDATQQNPKVMNQAMINSAWKLAELVDQHLAARMVAGADSDNVIGTLANPVVPTSTAGSEGAYELLVDMNTILNENNVPREGRWAIVPPWYEGRLVKDDRFIHAEEVSLAMGNPLVNGAIGRAAGMAIMVSNNVPTEAGPDSGDAIRSRIVAGHGIATTFADQISKVEAYRPERRFADAVKGLHLYGSKVVRPTALSTMYAIRSGQE